MRPRNCITLHWFLAGNAQSDGKATSDAGFGRLFPLPPPAPREVLSSLSPAAPREQEFKIMAKAHFFQDTSHPTSAIDSAANVPPLFLAQHTPLPTPPKGVRFILSSINTNWLWQTNQQNQLDWTTTRLFPLISPKCLPFFFFFLFLFSYHF